MDGPFRTHRANHDGSSGRVQLDDGGTDDSPSRPVSDVATRKLTIQGAERTVVQQRAFGGSNKLSREIPVPPDSEVGIGFGVIADEGTLAEPGRDAHESIRFTVSVAPSAADQGADTRLLEQGLIGRGRPTGVGTACPSETTREQENLMQRLQTLGYVD